MEVKFDVVRIGEIRKNHISEMILKQNVGFLKNHVISLLADIDCEINSIGIVLVIPGKGHSIKIALEGVKSKDVKRILKRNIPNSIYNGKYSIITDNVGNKIWDGY